MNTTEDRITADLAIVGRMSVARATPLEATLRAVGAIAGEAASELALVVLARVFVARVARAAAGIASLLCMVSVLVSLAVPRSAGWIDRDSHGGFGRELLEARRSWIGLAVVAVVLAAYVVASGIAARAFERAAARARDPLGAARRLVRDADGWAAAASIVGISTFVVGFGMLGIVVGREGLIRLLARTDAIGEIRHVALGSLRGAFVAIIAGAVVVARYGDRPWLRCTGWMVPVGFVLGLGTCAVAARFDVGPLVVTLTGHARPSPAIRIALTAAGTVAVFLVTAGTVLRARRREAAAIASVVGPAGSRSLRA
jgi:hypothetical protein